MHGAALVIFDCDGVLVDSEPVAARVLADLVTELGQAMTAGEAITRFTGLSLTTVLGLVEADVIAATGRPLPPDFRATLAARDAEAFGREVRAIDGVREVLEGLDGRRCVASSGTFKKMRLTLGTAGLLPLVEAHLFSAVQVARGKPAPDLFLFAAAEMGREAAACVVIEDSVAGIAAAVAAGMTAFGFCGGSHCGPDHAERLRAAGATATFATMATLPKLLNGPAPVGR